MVCADHDIIERDIPVTMFSNEMPGNRGRIDQATALGFVRRPRGVGRHPRPKGGNAVPWKRIASGIGRGGARSYMSLSHDRLPRTVAVRAGAEDGPSPRLAMILRVAIRCQRVVRICMAKSELRRFEMLAPPEWFEAIDKWRAQQPGLPARAEAIRRLVEKGLAEKPK